MHEEFDRIINDLETELEEEKSIKLEWIDYKTKEVLFTVQDIEIYDQNRQIFKLKPGADKEFQEWCIKNVKGNRLYSLRSSKGIIYSGDICSKTFPGTIGPEIVVNIPSDPNHLESPYYRIKGLNYSEQAFLLDHLKKAGVLGTIEKPFLWIDKKTGHILFTSDDIEVFDWEKQKFILKSDPLKKFCLWVRKNVKQNRPFIVRDYIGYIYNAMLVSSKPLIDFIEFPWIDISACKSDKGLPEYFEINRPHTKHNLDSDRIKSVLKQAGVLGTIDTQEKGDK